MDQIDLVYMSGGFVSWLTVYFTVTAAYSFYTFSR